MSFALHPDIELEHLGDQVLLMHPHTGRHVRLHAETFARLDTLAPVQTRLRRLNMHADANLDELLVVRHRRTLWLPEERCLWVPVPTERGAGGYGYRPVQLTTAEAAIYGAINDHRTLLQLASASGSSLPSVRTLVSRLSRRECPCLQAHSRRPPPLWSLLSPPRETHARSPDQHDATGQTTLTEWHLHSIHDGETHFDDRETTIAHAHAIPHPGLGGQTFGARLREALGDAVRGHVVEVGCGTGELAAAFLEAGPLAYTRLDLSPELLRTQARRVDTGAILADGTAMPLRDGCVDLLVSNEVLADLTATPWDGSADLPELTERLEAAGIPPLPGVYNLGAMKLVEEAWRVLRRGGTAWLSEFGGPDEPPTETEQLDHPEVSIHFGQLAARARALGATVSLQRLDGFLDVDLHAPQLHRGSYEALRALCRARGHHLQARAWTPSTLTLPWAVEGLTWTHLADEGPGPLMTRFWCLQMHKPA